MRVELPYGRRALMLDLGDRDVDVVRAMELPPPPPLEQLLDEALADARFVVSPGSRVTIIISDPTRDEPRDAFLAALLRKLPSCRVTVAIATGTHGPCRLEALGIGPARLDGLAIVNHDGGRSTDLVELGTTARGTPVRVHRCVVDTDLVIATGCIRPHYFAGFGAGAKAIFPGLGESTAIRTNHRWKTDPRARPGNLDGNPCRDDIEEAVAFVPTPKLLLDGVCDPSGAVRAVVSGELGEAYRHGCALAKPWFVARAKAAPLVIASDKLPVTASLYQAAKIAAATAPLVAAGGALVIAAECAEGIGPLDVVNEAIFRIGVLPRLAMGVQLFLVSCLSADSVEKTLVHFAPSVDEVVTRTSGRVVVVPQASQLLMEVE